MMRKFVVLLPEELHAYLKSRVDELPEFETTSQYLRYLVKMDKEATERGDRNETQ